LIKLISTVPICRKRIGGAYCLQQHRHTHTQWWLSWPRWDPTALSTQWGYTVPLNIIIIRV